MMKRAAYSLIAGVFVAAALGGCASKEEPAPQPSATLTQSAPTPSGKFSDLKKHGDDEYTSFQTDPNIRQRVPDLGAFTDSDNADVYPGVPYVIKGDDGSESLCTLGPVFTDSAGGFHAVSAGHCFEGSSDDVLYLKDGSRIGKAEDVHFTENEEDYALISLDGSRTISQKANNTIPLEYVAVSSETLSAMPVVCTIGAISGVDADHCGSVRTFGDDGSSILSTYNKQVNGDSGGPVVMQTADGRVGVVGIVMASKVDGTYSLVYSVDKVIPSDWSL